MPDDAYKTVGEVFTNQGLKFESHKIQTEDGYILTAWRVAGFSFESPQEISLREPVIL